MEQFEHIVLGDWINIGFYDGRTGIADKPIHIDCHIRGYYHIFIICFPFIASFISYKHISWTGIA